MSLSTKEALAGEYTHIAAHSRQRCRMLAKRYQSLLASLTTVPVCAVCEDVVAQQGKLLESAELYESILESLSGMPGVEWSELPPVREKLASVLHQDQRLQGEHDRL